MKRTFENTLSTEDTDLLPGVGGYEKRQHFSRRLVSRLERVKQTSLEEKSKPKVGGKNVRQRREVIQVSV